MGVSMPKITISGHPGSGTSTLVSGLVNHFNWRYLNGGQVFRDEAKLRNMTLEEFGELCVYSVAMGQCVPDERPEKCESPALRHVQVPGVAREAEVPEDRRLPSRRMR